MNTDLRTKVLKPVAGGILGKGESWGTQGEWGKGDLVFFRGWVTSLMAASPPKLCIHSHTIPPATHHNVLGERCLVLRYLIPIQTC